MRRATAFSVAAGVIVLLLTALAVVEYHRPTGWQDELLGYLARLSAAGDDVRLLAAKRAPRAELFDGHLSRAVQGNQSYTAKPLPFPPDALYCVYLEHHYDASPVYRQLVFVARHYDLHSADWVLHEGDVEPFPADVVRDLRGLGCVAVLGI